MTVVLCDPLTSLPASVSVATLSFVQSIIRKAFLHFHCLLCSWGIGRFGKTAALICRSSLWKMPCMRWFNFSGVVGFFCGFFCVVTFLLLLLFWCFVFLVGFSLFILIFLRYVCKSLVSVGIQLFLIWKFLIYSWDLVLDFFFSSFCFPKSYRLVGCYRWKW